MIQTIAPWPQTPHLAIGQTVAGKTVVAAVRQQDRPGYLPGLHVVTARDAREYVTWEVAYQDGIGWVANAGHYFPITDGDTEPDTKRAALADMLARA